MKSILLLTIALNILSGCAGFPKRAKFDFCGINFATNKPAHLHCFDSVDDYTEDGVMKPGAKAHDKKITSPQMLNAGKYISKEDWPKVETWLLDIRNYGKDHCDK